MTFKPNTPKPDQTLAERAAEVRADIKRIDQLVAARTVRVIVGPQGAVAFDGLTREQRDGLSDACIYRRAAVATAEAICRAFNQGDTFAHVQSVMSARYLTPEQATAYIQDAVAFYCPRAQIH